MTLSLPLAVGFHAHRQLQAPEVCSVAMADPAFSGPAGSGKTQDARRLLETATAPTVALDFQSLYAALLLLERNPDGRYPERQARHDLRYSPWWNTCGKRQSPARVSCRSKRNNHQFRRQRHTARFSFKAHGHWRNGASHRPRAGRCGIPTIR